MKKKLLFALLSIISLTALGQGPLTKDWEILASGASGSLIGNTTLQTTIAYNKVTGKLYLPERNNKISILNPSNGALSTPATLATLTTAPAWTQSNKYTKIRVTEDGVIYACNMTTGAGTVYIYRWASETDNAPTTSAITVAARTGDSFAVTGTGVNTVIYLSGSGNPYVYVCTTTDGVVFTLTKTVTLGVAGDARSSISAVSGVATSDIWVNAPNVETKRISTNSAGAITATSSVATSVINQIYANTEYIQEGTEKYLAVTGAVIGSSYNSATGLGLDFKLYKVTNFASPPTTGVTEVGTGKLSNVSAASPATFYQNPNAYADVAYIKNANGTYTFYNLICNNGLAAYTTAGTLPVSLSGFTVAVKNNVSTLDWSTVTESNNRGFEIKRSTDGKEFVTLDFVTSKADQGNSSSIISYSYEDKSALSGINYYRLNQIDLDGKSKLHEVKVVNISLDAAKIEVFPNPVTSYLKVKVADYRGYEYKIYNSFGKVVISEKAKKEETEISTGDLSPSIYVLKIRKGGQEVNSLKIVKQ